MNKQLFVFALFFFSVNLVFAERSYKYIRIVDPKSKNAFSTINEAIEDIKKCNLSSEDLGCIQVYPATYTEQVNSFYPGGNNLPAHCDIIGMGDKSEDVIIQHQRRAESDPDFTNIVSEIYADGILCDGDNLIENIKLSNIGSNQNGIEFKGAGTLNNCIIVSRHDALTSQGHLVVKDCKVEGWYRPCIHSYSTFDISDSIFYPKTRSWGGQHPAGIKATKSGSITNVTIQADISSSDYEPHYDTPWLAGIILQLRNPDDVVTITNANINLILKTIFHDTRPNETADWELFGIVSGGRNPNPTTSYPGKAVVNNCQITLEGIEDNSNPNGDGRAIMIAGICVQGGGEIDVTGNTSINTTRKTATYADEGFEYTLNNKNGIVSVDPNTVVFNKAKTNGEIAINEPKNCEKPKDLISSRFSFIPESKDCPMLIRKSYLKQNAPMLSKIESEQIIQSYSRDALANLPSYVSERMSSTQENIQVENLLFNGGASEPMGAESQIQLQEITSSTVLDPSVIYYVPNPPLLIHSLDSNPIDVVIPSDTTIILAEDWDYGIVIYDNANVFFGAPHSVDTEPSETYPSNDISNPVPPVWILGENGSLPFFNNFCGISIERTAGTKSRIDNIYLSGFYYGIQADQQLESAISNITSIGCYNGILSFGPNEIFNSIVSYYGLWSAEWSYYGYAYEFMSQSSDGLIVFDGADFEIHNCLADDGDYGFTANGITNPTEDPIFHSVECAATNCYTGFNCINGTLGINVVCPGLYNNFLDKNFTELPFTNPINETNNPFIVAQNDYRLFLNPTSQFVDNGLSATPFQGWTTRLDGNPDEDFGDIWPHYQTIRSDKYPLGDIQSDGTVSIDDLIILAGEWLSSTPVSADITEDQNVDLVDFSVIANYWNVTETKINIINPENLEAVPLNNVSGYVGIELSDIPSESAIISVYLDHIPLGDIQLNWDDELELIDFESDSYSNGWHIIRVVSFDYEGKVINHKSVNVYFDNLLYNVSGSDYFHPNETYEYSGFYDGGLDLEFKITNLDQQVIWSNTYSGSYIYVSIPGSTFLNENFCELSISEVESSMAMEGMSAPVSSSSSSSVKEKDLKKKFKEEDCPSNVRMAIILPNKDVFKKRKSAILECAKACEKRGVSWVVLYHKNVTEKNLTFLFNKTSLRYIYWCGHANSHVGKGSERVQRTRTACWDKGSGFFGQRKQIGVFSYANHPTKPLPDNWDTLGFDLWPLKMYESWNKKIIFIDGCLTALYPDMANTYGVFSLQGQGSKDQIFIGWRKKVVIGSSQAESLVGNTTEGVRVFWEQMGNGQDIYDALDETRVVGGQAMRRAIWGDNGDLDIGDADGDDNLFLWGNGLIHQIKLNP